MNNEYVVTRLKAMIDRFIADEQIGPIASNKSLKSIMLIFDNSIFSAEAEKLKSRPGYRLSTESLIRIVEHGYISIMQRAADIVRLSMEEHQEVLFSRIELEQLKYAMRCARTGESLYEKRLGFVQLMPHGNWVNKWRSFNNIKEFVAELRKIGHPLASAFDMEKPVDDPIKMEADLERYFFADYLPKNRRLLKGVMEYHAWQNNLINLQMISLLRGRTSFYHQPGDYHIPGPGAIGRREFLEMLEMRDSPFLKRIETISGKKPSQKIADSPIRLSTFLRRSLLDWMRRQTIAEPVGLINIPYFIERLSAMAVNLKTALYFGKTGAPFEDMHGYMIFRKAT